MAEAKLAGLFCLIVSTAAAAAPAPTPYPKAEVEPVRDSYFGVDVVDAYRWMETPKSERFAGYLKAQNAYARKTLDAVEPARSQMLERIKTLQRGNASVRFVSRVAGNYFALETPADAKDARLVVRAVAGGASRVLLEPSHFGSAKGHPSIDFYNPSIDGKHVVVAVSHGGSEDWTFHFIDVATGAVSTDAVDHIAEPFPSWTADQKGIYYPRLQAGAAGVDDTTKLDNIRIYRHTLGTEQAKDVPVFGRGVVDGVEISPHAFVSVQVSNDGRFEIASSSEGVEAFRTYWIRDLKAAKPAWRRIADVADKVALIADHDGRIYCLNQKTAAGQLVVFSAIDGTAASAKVLIDDPTFVVSTEGGYIAAPNDALYVSGMRDGHAVIRRVTYDGATAPVEVSLPGAGSLIEFTADDKTPGFVFSLQSPTLSPRVYSYDPATKANVDTRLSVAHPADFSGIETRELSFKSTDGADVPVSVTLRKDLVLDGSHPTLMTVYGAYGAVVPMWFSAPNLAWYERGGLLVLVHARGGGEKGEDWHQAAVKTKKQHTIDDVIAAARGLIDARYTSPVHLAIAGKSAGGIAASGAIVQHPELFGAALIRVGVTDMLRFEQGALGASNTSEYGSTTNPDEFKALRALSAYANVRDGVAYPAVLLETGINDPRVPPWQLGKMTARLQAATSSKRPILLRVDYDAGHGLGSDKDQVAALMADEFAFLGWQLGMPGFSPH